MKNQRDLAILSNSQKRSWDMRDCFTTIAQEVRWNGYSPVRLSRRTESLCRQRPAGCRGVDPACRASVRRREPPRREHRQDDCHGSQDGDFSRQNSLYGVEQCVQVRRDPPGHRGSPEKSNTRASRLSPITICRMPFCPNLSGPPGNNPRPCKRFTGKKAAMRSSAETAVEASAHRVRRTRSSWQSKPAFPAWW